MYTIGEFSRITGLTVKALRYYDEKNILNPSQRGENAYRLYSEEDFQRAQLVAFLRGVDFGIAEICEVLAHGDSEEDLQFYLNEKREQIASNVARERELMERIGQYLKPIDKKEREMCYQVKKKSIPAATVCLLRFEGTFEDIGKHTGTLFKEVKGNAAGPPFCLYHDAEITEVATIDLGVPVKSPINSAGVRTDILPPIEALCTTHIGPYEELRLAYKAVLDYARENGLKLLLPWRETYLKGPGMMFKGNPNKYVTEIQVPCEEERYG